MLGALPDTSPPLSSLPAGVVGLTLAFEPHGIAPTMTMKSGGARRGSCRSKPMSLKFIMTFLRHMSWPWRRLKMVNSILQSYATLESLSEHEISA
jgi:hypothetical protein